MSTLDQQDYLFDLRGYLVLKGAVDADHVRALNDALDKMPKLETLQWHGNVQRSDAQGDRGVELQNIVEGGELADQYNALLAECLLRQGKLKEAGSFSGDRMPRTPCNNFGVFCDWFNATLFIRLYMK